MFRRNKSKQAVEQVKGELQQFVDRASDDATRAEIRERIDESMHAAQETAADVKEMLDRQAVEVQKNLAERGSQARTALAGLQTMAKEQLAAVPSALESAAEVIDERRRDLAKMSAKQRKRLEAMDLGKKGAAQANAAAAQASAAAAQAGVTARKLGRGAAGEVGHFTDRYTARTARRRIQNVVITLVRLAVVAGLLAVLADSLSTKPTTAPQAAA